MTLGARSGRGKFRSAARTGPGAGRDDASVDGLGWPRGTRGLRSDPASRRDAPDLRRNAVKPEISAETALDRLAINTIRFLAVDAIEKSRSGHPGLPMGMADVGYAVWTRFLRHDPADPAWPGRDRFVLSAGHGSMLLYALLHLSGYDLPMEELQ